MILSVESVSRDSESARCLPAKVHQRGTSAGTPGGAGVRVVAAAFSVLFFSVILGCYADPVSDPPFEASLDLQLRDSLRRWGAALPIAEIPPQNQALVELGRALFFDKELSGNRDVSCATCHDPVTHGTDGMPLAVGTGGHGAGVARLPGSGRQFTPRNAPSMLNVALTFPYVFWDGRLPEFGHAGPFEPADVPFPGGLSGVMARQATLPLLNRVEMRGERGDRDRFGNPNELAMFSDSAAPEVWAAIMRRLLAFDGYVSLFQAAYPGAPAAALGIQHAANAVAAFELGAFTRVDSPFDRFLRREAGTMSEEALRGGLLFFGSARCAQCHNGPLLGGQQFANIGIPQHGPGLGVGAPLDFGRAELFAQDQSLQSSPYVFAFRVPPLRNVELTAPYMHNGAYPTLEVVVRHYSNADSALRSYDISQLGPSLRGAYHGDAATIGQIATTMDFRVRDAIRLTALQQRDLVAFLKSLTDPAARSLTAIAPADVPSGLPVRE